jgi:hypothetical protein
VSAGVGAVGSAADTGVEVSTVGAGSGGAEIAAEGSTKLGA